MRPYQAELARAEANLNQARAHLKRLELDYNRSVNLTASKALSPQEFDKVAGDRAEGLAAVEVAKAQRDVAELTLSYTKVHSPIKGRLSRSQIDPGNLVKADETLLTTVVTQDPIYAYFDVDERSMLRLRRWAQEGASRPTSPTCQSAWRWPMTRAIRIMGRSTSRTTRSIRIPEPCACEAYSRIPTTF